MGTWRGVCSVVLAGAVIAGCARSHPVAEVERPHEPVTLEVDNHNWADVIVYAVRSGHRMRLGTVVAVQAATLTIAPDMIGPGGEVRIYARAIGSGARYTSPRVYASPGGTVALVLETDMRRSTLTSW